MTFTEAAVEVLRLVGRPLHYKKIAEIAIAKNLLSHVGKAPDLTMSSRLATMIKKDRGDEPIVKVKPGVFGLREFTKDVLELDADFDVDIDALPDIDLSARPESAEEEEENDTPPPKLPGSDVFPEEEDDDVPILAAVNAPAEDDDDGEGGGKSRRRRRRRGRRGKDDEDDRESGGDRDRDNRDRDNRDRDNRDRDNRDRGRDRGGRDRNRDRDRGRNRDRDRDRDRDRGRRGRDREAERLDMSRTPEEGDLAGRELADAIEAALAGASREPTTFAGAAELLVQRGRLSGTPAALAPTVAAAVRADSVRRGAAASRFREVEGRLALTSWYFPEDLVQSTKELRQLTRVHREQTHRAFLRKLESLPAAGFVELMASWLNAEGISGLRAVRRPGSSAQELHLAGTLSRGHEQVPVAIVVLRGGRDLDAETVVEVRGALHHYGQASMAWLVALGRARGRARQEVAVGGAPPAVLFDGEALAAAMESRGIGLRPTVVSLPTIDLDLLDALRGAAADPEPEPDEDRGRRRRGRRGDREDREDREEVSDERDEAAPEPAEAAPEAEAGEAEADAGGEESGGKKRRRRRRRRGRRDEEGGAEEARAEGADEDAGEPGDAAAAEEARGDAFEDDAEAADAEEAEADEAEAAEELEDDEAERAEELEVEAGYDEDLDEDELDDDIEDELEEHDLDDEGDYDESDYDEDLDEDELDDDIEDDEDFDRDDDSEE